MGTGGGKIIQKKRNTATIQILSLPSAFNDLFIDVRKMFTAKKKCFSVENHNILIGCYDGLHSR